MTISIEEECFSRYENEREHLGVSKPVNLVNPVVSVIVETYQHKDFIKECLDGILMQNTDFDFEIILGEDGSDDGTREICIEYAEKHTDKIRLFLRNRETSQLYDEKGNFIFRFNALWNHMSARGKYIAWCEGDDYWTDPEKLKKQIEVLEENPNYSLCFHNAKVIYSNSKKKPHLFAKLTKNEFDIYDIITKQWFIPSQSMVFRKEFFNSPEWSKFVFGPDFALQLRLALKGKIIGINENMSIYRKHNGGVSANQPTNYTSLKKIETLSFFNMDTNFQFNSTIQKVIFEINDSLYINALYSRPIAIRIFSMDFYIFKINNFFKNRISRISYY